MSLRIRPLCEISPGQLADLERRLQIFYSNPPESYYLLAEEASLHYNPDEQPFHCDLASRARPGDDVLELGCGTAHLCPHIEKQGAFYTGADYSRELLEQNRHRFPKARFFPIESDLHQQFDLVCSLYTIEHVVNPILYLERLWSFTKVGGLLGIICPDFIDGEGIPRAVYYGKTPERIRQKLISGRLWDALLHMFELKFAAPRWKHAARTREPGAFWINLDPSDLAGRDHGIDGDAVHFPRLADLQSWIEQKGGQVITTSRQMPDVKPAVIKHNCYILARKLH